MVCGDTTLDGDPDLLFDVPASTYRRSATPFVGPVAWTPADARDLAPLVAVVVAATAAVVVTAAAPPAVVDGFPVPSETRFFFRGCCSKRRNESSTIATFLLSRSVGSVSMPRVSKEPCRAGVMSRLGGLLLDESESDFPSLSRPSSAWPSLGARLFVAWPVLEGEMVWFLGFCGFFLVGWVCWACVLWWLWVLR